MDDNTLAPGTGDPFVDLGVVRDDEKLAEEIAIALCQVDPMWRGNLWHTVPSGIKSTFRCYGHAITDIIAREVAAETERCAQVAEEYPTLMNAISEQIAVAIREDRP